ncbi:UDP-glucose 4-epimerase GalE [Thermobifida fusca]|jgi:UDP-glucose 4-epimerase|uniref:UDP-glucose 4-epimerase n=2 Tax=Thermobifida fusca TaxID=2021 RepID=A0A9P2T8C4_THEFU|nr:MULTISPECIES: UDP-glucose 4-epimerase GalE [Thermobifida]AAZ56624.1 UDP-galactose 4-epimerase [Thermobifida fusca YX]EOR70325.1 UDP-galactose 4-epimerase [Thermobifida fusca TM51]MBO2528458.1 UDP-glucose 4-epimerase GalE [Thermobifida sp.]PPS93308.1 UDP-galactose-4-epimerase [Thermobifida fusca]PZN63666.1 MAG: UDP-glucose 4-epimerase GalE [Thermobifida fusca]
MNVLLTGGAGYIGTHVAVELLENGHDVVVVDNLRNSHAEAVRRVERITGRSVHFYVGDCADRELMDRVFTEHRIDAAVHCAGLKAVGESVELPLLYYRNNLDALLTVCEAMDAHGVRSLVFSSSATVYGDPDRVPIPEDAPLRATNPYGATKLFAERILSDLVASAPDWRIITLRYFNPVGAHPSGLIGEDPEGVPNNLFPYIAQVAAGRRERVLVYGDDYATPDGTGVRDYLHVMDLARGHVAALERLGDAYGMRTYNLGSGHGVSVLEAIAAFERACGKTIPYEVVARRPGDIAVCYADPSAANRDLGWKTAYTLDEACAHLWRWQTMNPNGFAG